MLQFLIERDIPDAGRLTPSELQAIAQQISGVLRQLNEEITWIHSYVIDDKFNPGSCRDSMVGCDQQAIGLRYCALHACGRSWQHCG
ncbi:MAG TPA: nickel-binding protein [Anaerolineae bacterium]